MRGADEVCFHFLDGAVVSQVTLGLELHVRDLGVVRRRQPAGEQVPGDRFPGQDGYPDLKNTFICEMPRLPHSM